MNRLRMSIAIALMAAVVALATWNHSFLRSVTDRFASPAAASDLPGGAGLDAASRPRTPIAAATDAEAQPDRSQTLRAKVSAHLDDTILVDGDGFTLYRSSRDSARPPTSACRGECTNTWRPVIAAEVAADQERVRLRGVDPAVVGSNLRADGSRQLTIAGWPVYRFRGDHRPGATDGHCVDGFSAITPEGDTVMQIRVW